jgi:cytochrome c556
LKFALPTLALAAVLAVAPTASVSQSRAAAEIKSRQASFKQLGAAYKAVNDELKKDAPDSRVIAANAARMNALSRQLPRWFPRGSGPEARVKTGARSEIWSDAAAFAAAAQALQTQTARLQQVSHGDLTAVRAQARATGGSCKGCHDRFRNEDKS